MPAGDRISDGSHTVPQGNPLQETIHATTVAFKGRAVAIFGASGSGKSTLALELMARGARLVADDQTILAAEPEGIMARAPEPLVGKIEARGVGILGARPVKTAPLALVIDLDQIETQRLPKLYTIARLGVTLPLLKRVDSPSFPVSILQFLSCGRLPQ